MPTAIEHLPGANGILPLSLAKLVGRRCKDTAYCDVSLDTGRSRSRAVSLLTGVHVPHLSFIYLKKYPPQIKVYSYFKRGVGYQWGNNYHKAEIHFEEPDI